MAAAERNSNNVLLWDTWTNLPPHVLKGHKYSPFRLAFSGDSQRLATGDGGDYTVKIWDVETGRELFTIPGKTDRTDVASYSLFFSQSGEQLITGNQDGKIKIWNAAP
jgi:WD40 repeat protein